MMRCPREEVLDWAVIRLQRAGIPLAGADPLPAEVEDLGPLVRHAGECVRCGEILGLLYATEGAQQAEEAVMASAAPGRVAAIGKQILALFPFEGIAADGPTWSADAADAADAADVFEAVEEYLVAANSPST